MSDEYIKSINQDRITTIEFYHPAHNSLTSDLLASFVHHIKEAGEEENTSIIVIRSSGDKTFCAGASLKELVQIQDLDEGKDFFMGFANVVNAIRKSPKIVIGVVQGKLIGGGVGIAAACDYCLASKYASLKLSELSIGIGPFVIGPVVERKIGLSAFSQLSLNADEWQTAEWGKQRGLFAEAFETNQQLEAYVDHFTKSLASKSPIALKELKQIFWQDTSHWDTLLHQRAEISGNLILSEYAQNALKTLLN